MPDRDCEIFLIEDDSTLRDQLTQLIKAWGYRIRVAREVPAALASITERQPDIILTDMVLLPHYGIEVLEYVHTRWPELPVLVMTAFASLESAVDALKRGAYDYLLKPFTPPELDAALNRARSTIALRRLREREAHLRHTTAVALTLTHEINNPLAVITGEIELLLENQALGAEEQHVLEVCLESAQRIAEVVRKVATLREVVYQEYGGLQLLDLDQKGED